MKNTDLLSKLRKGEINSCIVEYDFARGKRKELFIPFSFLIPNSKLMLKGIAMRWLNHTWYDWEIKRYKIPLSRFIGFQEQRYSKKFIEACSIRGIKLTKKQLGIICKSYYSFERFRRDKERLASLLKELRI